MDRWQAGAFEIAGGSVAGARHREAGRNNQDAFGWAETGVGLVAVVCDGCSAGRHSEVGAYLGARLVVGAVSRLLGLGLGPEEILERARQEVLEGLRPLVAAMSVETEASLVVSESFLFTVVGAVVSDGLAWGFSLGDGLIVLNGERRRLGPFPGNEPPYLGYALLGGDRFRFEHHRPVPVDGLDSLLLGTDGVVDLDEMADRSVPGRAGEQVGPLSQLWTEDRYFRNPDMVRRKLVVLNRGPHGLLPDDTTVVVIRRRPGAGGGEG